MPESGADSPKVTHRAHVRYAANGRPGTRWYDPRDGREKLNIEHHPADVEPGERRIVTVRVEPCGWSETVWTHVVYDRRPDRRNGEIDDTTEHEDLDAALEHLSGAVDGWDEFPRCDAVATRTGLELDHAPGVPNTREQYEQADLMEVSRADV